MPLNKLSQKSFVNGQYDRTAQNQESVSGAGIVARGLSYAKNVLSSDRGEVRKRLGTRFLKQLSDAAVIVPFRNKDKDDILLFTQNRLDVLEYIEGSVGTVENYQQGVDTKVEKTWTSNTVDGYTVSVTPRGTSGNAAFNMFQKPYIWYEEAPSVAAAHPFIDGYEYLGDLAGGGIYPPNQFFMEMQLPSDSIVGKFSVIFAVTHNRGDVPTDSGYTGYTNAVIQYSDDNSTWTSVNTIISSAVGDTPRYWWHYKPIWNGSVGSLDTSKIENIIMYDVILNDNVENHRYWRVLFSNPVDSHDRLYSQKLNIQFYTRSLTPYSSITTDITNLKNIKYAQNGNNMKLTDGEHNPKTITLGAGYSCSDYTPTSPSNLWTTLGKPSCVEYFQNRLWWSGFNAYPNRVIASKFNQINDYTTSSPAQVDDALDLSCNQLGSQITNIKGGQKVLYCFSEDGISNVDGGSSGLIATNENIEFILKNRMPAGSSTPAFKDDVMLYSSSDGTKLYGLDFDLLVNRFQVKDLAIYAKDVTKEKVTELHYVNNESKLVYGLTESGKMFALLYEKGAYQGFFPMDFNGTVYDIAPIKVGRDYKLLMVVFRNGNWYLEEKLDCGNYIDTSSPRLTSEEKKWATYDNLENNIALDCYQTYDESFNAETQITNETHIVSNVDLSGYTGKSIMLANDNEKDFVIAKINSTEVLYAWNGNNTLDSSINWFTLSDRPEDGDSVYDEYGNVMTGYNVSGSYHAGTPGYITVLEPPRFGVRPAVQVYENPDVNKYIESIEIETARGTTTSFNKIYPEFTTFQPNLPSGSSVGVISEGRYFNAQTPDSDGYITLPMPCHKVIYGVNYEALAILKIQTPYESMKQVAQVDVSVIDTTHLEIGTDFNDTQYIEKIDDSSYYDLTRITMNDTYRVVVGDTPEMTKNIILRSNKGVPFTVNAVDVYVNYSNLGGD